MEHQLLLIKRVEVAKLSQKKSGIVVQRLNYVALLDAVKKAASGIFSSEDCEKVAALYDKQLRYQEYINLYEEILGTTSL